MNLRVSAKGRGTADALGDLCFTLEDPQFNQKMEHIVFLDVFHPFDSLPHATTLQQLSLKGVLERLCVFFYVIVVLLYCLRFYRES